MAIEIIGDCIISLMDTSLLYMLVGLFLSKRVISKPLRILPFLAVSIIHFLCTVIHIAPGPLKLPVFFFVDVLFCFLQFRDKWYKYAVNVGLFYILSTIIELFFIAIITLLVGFDAVESFSTYELSVFAMIVLVRLIMLFAILGIKKLVGRPVQQKQWYSFLLMPVLTIAFVWFIYPSYWGMGNVEINKLLTYVGVFLIIQNVFVFFYIISLQSSTQQYVEMKEAFDRREEYARTVKAIQFTVRKMAHDIRHHFIYLMSALEKEDISKAKQYLINLDENLDNLIPLKITGHYDVDALLYAKSRVAAQANMHIKVEGSLPPELAISPVDLSVLLGNSLENAIEAGRKLDGEKEIAVTFGYREPRLSFTISNPYDGKIKKNPNGYFASRKRNGGLGVEIMDQVVKRYNGMLVTNYDQQRFTLTVMLQTQ